MPENKRNKSLIRDMAQTTVSWKIALGQAPCDFQGLQGSLLGSHKVVLLIGVESSEMPKLHRDEGVLTSEVPPRQFKDLGVTCLRLRDSVGASVPFSLHEDKGDASQRQSQ